MSNYAITVTGCLSILLLINVSGCKRQAILYNPPAVIYPSLTIEDEETGKTVIFDPAEARPKLSIGDMEAAIVEGCAKRGWWKPEKAGAGVVDAIMRIRSHALAVRILFGADRFSINFLSSDNLNYGVDEKGVEQIHPNYNYWVTTLKNDITLAIANQTRKNKQLP